MLMWEVDFKRVRVDLHDGTLTPLEKVTQVLGKLGVAEPQSHPQETLPNVPLPQLPTLTVCGRGALSMGNERRAGASLQDCCGFGARGVEVSKRRRV
jgi:hypothetical protein